MLDLINDLSLLDDLMIIAGIFLVAFEQQSLGILFIVGGLGVMFMKGEIGVPVK